MNDIMNKWASYIKYDDVKCTAFKNLHPMEEFDPIKGMMVALFGNDHYFQFVHLNDYHIIQHMIDICDNKNTVIVGIISLGENRLPSMNQAPV